MAKIKVIKSRKSKLPKDDEYLWKYFDIHRFLNLMMQKRLRFSRMDQFKDPLEGIPMETIQHFAQVNKEGTYNLGEIIVENEKTEFPKNNLISRLDVVRAVQTRNFVSCWFYDQRESMAMWNLYSNTDGVAIKIPFGRLRSNIKLDNPLLEIEDYYCGMVNYQDFKSFDPYKNNNSLREVQRLALRKDISFSHEKELRFVAKLSKSNMTLTGIDSAKLNLQEIDMKIICHPQMADWKKGNIRQMLKAAKLSKSYNESEIRLRY